MQAVEAPLLDGAGKASKQVSLDGGIFAAEVKPHLVHETVRAELNAQRAGTRGAKSRGMVSGGGAKPWRQKGTGRARAGSSRSPIWTGGGVIFGPQLRSYTFKVNRKERRAALRSALSVHAGRDSLAILDPAPFADTPSAKGAAALLADWAGTGSVLVVLTEEQVGVARSFRNLERVSVLPALGVGVADVIGASRLLISEDALSELTGRVTAEPRSDEED